MEEEQEADEGDSANKGEAEKNDPQVTYRGIEGRDIHNEHDVVDPGQEGENNIDKNDENPEDPGFRTKFQCDVENDRQKKESCGGDCNFDIFIEDFQNCLGYERKKRSVGTRK